MRRFDNFSPYDFEIFVGDLLGAELGVRFEAFPRGADGGIDLRYVAPNRKRPHVVQCKHYAGSAFSNLLTAAKREAGRLAKLDPKPLTYRFVTSRGLTATNKARLATLLSPWIKHENDVVGAQDLEGLLDRHPDVERRQVKLWLTGGTQLAALLRAGTIHRSQSLLYEIERAMPRYVQSQIFAEARERLRDQHVLVVAGVPGIGKTTLARMLLADAVLDGYEPIEVSADIEEGWEILDDGVKQVFLYDDFLGRTAISERFAKNEDRRLIEFMRRTARRRSSLLVLTTREYILRQAIQLYERLDQEGIDSSRFLLELPNYTPLDRARIFANHAFHSPQLTRPMRRALLKDRSYLRIINHRNYNPRTIEWITGLAGRWDTNVRPDDYVAFALHTLEHPELIWKHAFEHEIDDHGRALLLALVSLPRRIPLSHLESAFEALCRERNLSLVNRAFKRTTAALDDSLLRTSHERDHRGQTALVADPHDPSIIDFVRDFLINSPEDIRDLARACVYFEQASWLLETTTESTDGSSRETLAELHAGLQRTYTSAAITMVTVRTGPGAFFSRGAGTRDFERRLLVLLDVARAHAAFAAWWREVFADRMTRWSQGEGEPESLLKLLGALGERDGVDLHAAAIAAKEVLTSTHNYVQGLEWLHQLRSTFPSAFDREEWDQHVSDFETWLHDDLSSSAEDMSDTSELDFVEGVADLFGLAIDDEIWDDAQEMVENNQAERDAEIDPDPPYDSPSTTRNSAAERREIDAMFIMLAD
ncbi:MAG: restriction endonuclease [Actinomycetota bacterium]|nr:restriction endonuclease [Actinomycetota bacterium]